MIYIISFSLMLMLHYFLFLRRISKGIDALSQGTGRRKSTERVNVSIVIPFRNESEVIGNLVDTVNLLDYPLSDYEVVFVDDDSTDDTAEIIAGSMRYDNWKVIQSGKSEADRAHKKNAVSEAISIAQGEIIFQTDADCKLPPNWIETMLSSFNENTAMVAGPVTFENEGSLFEKLQKLEYAGLSLAGAGLTGAQNPKICSAANLAFRKSVFIEVGGYKENLNLSSGDDELLMQKIAANTNYNINYCMDKEALVTTRSNESVKEFANQRKRWASKSLFYSDQLFIVRLVFIFLFYFSLLLLPLLSLFGNANSVFAFLVLLAGKTLIEFNVLKKGSGIFFSKRLLKYIILAEIVQIPYIVYASVAGIFGGYKWKGREVKR